MSSVYATSAIILKNVPYGDNSVIINAYTRDFGLMGMMVRGVHKNKKKFSSNLLLPMTIVEIVFSENKKSTLKNLKEISLEIPFLSIPNNIYKSTILMFMNEILYKTLKEEQPNSALFDYIKSSLMALEAQQNKFANMHLYFLAGLTHFLGIDPNFSQENLLFDLSEGTFTATKPNHNYYLEKDLKNRFHDIFIGTPFTKDELCITNQQRNQLLDALLLYYQLHLPGLHDIKSKSVLHEILNN